MRPGQKPGLETMNAHERRKIARNVFNWDNTISGAKLVLREVHRKYHVCRVRDIPSGKLRSVLCSTIRWAGNVYDARDRGERCGIVLDEDVARLGIRRTDSYSAIDPDDDGIYLAGWARAQAIVSEHLSAYARH
jgi:hypothetical protein